MSERVENFVNLLRKADKLFSGTEKENEEANKILEFLDEEVTTLDLDEMTNEEYSLFESYELGYSD